MAQIIRRPAATIGSTVIRQVNKFVETVIQSSEGAQLGLYVKNVEDRPGLNDLLNYYGLDDMLEATDRKKLDIISPFIGALLDLDLVKTEHAMLLTCSQHMWTYWSWFVGIKLGKVDGF